MGQSHLIMDPTNPIASFPLVFCYLYSLDAITVKQG